MESSKLKLHFESCHGKLVEKSIHLRQKPERLKNCRIDSGGMWVKQNKQKWKHHIIVLPRQKIKSPHTIGLELIKHCLNEATTNYPCTGRGKNTSLLW